MVRGSLNDPSAGQKEATMAKAKISKTPTKAVKAVKAKATKAGKAKAK